MLLVSLFVGKRNIFKNFGNTPLLSKTLSSKPMVLILIVSFTKGVLISMVPSSALSKLTSNPPKLPVVIAFHLTWFAVKESVLSGLKKFIGFFWH